MGFGDFLKEIQDACDGVANSIKNNSGVQEFNNSLEEANDKCTEGMKTGIEKGNQASKDANAEIGKHQP